jgi:dTDP-4-amino-4,6-dideoxygalactose transaminase
VIALRLELPSQPQTNVTEKPAAMTEVKVPFFDWAGLFNERKDEFSRVMIETASRGGFIMQRDVDEFEENLAAFIGVKHAIAVSDGTNAILLGLRASGVSQGDEIIVPSHSFIAAIQSIHYAGAIPVPVELSERDWLVDVAAIELAITPRTKAIMPVHVNGRVCQMEAIMAIAERHGLAVYEDSAQAAGAKLNGIGAGSWGRWGTYSFYPSKTLGCFGDAGALVTNDDDIAATVRAMRNHGANQQKTIPLDIDVWGTNCRMDNMHAAILNYKLGYYAEAIQRRREIAARYHEALSDIPLLRLPPRPEEAPYFDIYQNYEMCVDSRERRDGLREYLAQRNVGTIVQWGGFGIHQLRGLGFSQNCPKTDQFFETSLLLPMNHILTDGQVQHTINCVRSYFDVAREKNL